MALRRWHCAECGFYIRRPARPARACPHCARFSRDCCSWLTVSEWRRAERKRLAARHAAVEEACVVESKRALPPGSNPFGAPFRRHYSYLHGRKLNSWDEYHRANRELNLVDVGQKPEGLSWGKGRRPQVSVPDIQSIGRHM